jgi:hypothetical protein
VKLKPALEKFFLFHEYDLDPWPNSFNSMLVRLALDNGCSAGIDTALPSMIWNKAELRGDNLFQIEVIAVL